MLAQSFKTAEELGLDDSEHGALVKVLGMLEREEIPAQLFNMADVGEPECGTPGCIFGWAKTVGFTRQFLCDLPDGATSRPLFLPAVGKVLACAPYTASTTQAAMALRSYLTTGEPNWAEAMS